MHKSPNLVQKHLAHHQNLNAAPHSVWLDLLVDKNMLHCHIEWFLAGYIEWLLGWQCANALIPKSAPLAQCTHSSHQYNNIWHMMSI